MNSITTIQPTAYNRAQQFSAPITSARHDNPSAEKAHQPEKDYYTTREIDRLAEKIEKAFTYDRFASKALAENIVRGSVEFFA